MENQIVLSMTNVLTVLGGFVAIFGWFYMLISKKFERVEGDIKDVRSDVKDVRTDVKDVRERLIVIEVESKNTNQRLSTIEGYLVPKKVFRIEEPHEEEPKEN